MNFTLEHAKKLSNMMKVSSKDCRKCNGNGFRLVETAHEEIEDCHRSAGTYYTREKVKCAYCK